MINGGELVNCTMNLYTKTGAITIICTIRTVFCDFTYFNDTTTTTTATTNTIIIIATRCVVTKGLYDQQCRARISHLQRAI